MSGPGPREAPWLPWLLCGLAWVLLLCGVAWRLAFPDAADDGAVYVLASVSGVLLVPLVGARIAVRLPANPFGWLWCALGVDVGALAFFDGLRRTGAEPAWLTGILTAAAYFVFLTLLVFVVLLFPTGRLPGPRWRSVAVGSVAVAGVGLLALPFLTSTVDGIAGTPWAVGGRPGEILAAFVEGLLTAMFALVVLAALSLLVRFRRAGPVERQQLKWFLLAAALTAGSVLLDVFGVPHDGPVWAVLDAVTLALLPVAVGIAMLRYRLFEIDRIVSRTVSYGLLTGGLALLYLGLVALLRPLLEPITGGSSLAVAGSTLAVAAVFNPARRRLQAAVDRRFDRARYDAAIAVEHFAARLRDQVDVDQVVGGLRDTVAATVAPTRVGIWLRSGPVVSEV